MQSTIVAQRPIVQISRSVRANMRSPSASEVGPTAHERQKRDANSDVVQMFGGNSDALPRVEGRRVSGQTPADPPEPAARLASGPQARGEGWCNRVRFMSRIILSTFASCWRSQALRAADIGQHRHQLRSSTLPQAFNGGDRPPSLRKERTHKHLPPNDLTPKDRHCSATDLSQLRGHWGAMKAPIRLSTGGIVGASFTVLRKRGPEV